MADLSLLHQPHQHSAHNTRHQQSTQRSHAQAQRPHSPSCSSPVRRTRCGADDGVSPETTVVERIRWKTPMCVARCAMCVCVCVGGHKHARVTVWTTLSVPLSRGSVATRPRARCEATSVQRCPLWCRNLARRAPCLRGDTPRRPAPATTSASHLLSRGSRDTCQQPRAPRQHAWLIHVPSRQRHADGLVKHQYASQGRRQSHPRGARVCVRHRVRRATRRFGETEEATVGRDARRGALNREAQHR